MSAFKNVVFASDMVVLTKETYDRLNNEIRDLCDDIKEMEKMIELQIRVEKSYDGSPKLVVNVTDRLNEIKDRLKDAGFVDWELPEISTLELYNWCFSKKPEPEVVDDEEPGMTELNLEDLTEEDIDALIENTLEAHSVDGDEAELIGILADLKGGAIMYVETELRADEIAEYVHNKTYVKLKLTEVGSAGWEIQWPADEDIQE